MSHYKLGVEVISAHDLMPKNGQGSASPYVELSFDDQKFRTTTKEKDLNPVWNEQFYFNIADPSALHSLVLEANVFTINKLTNSKSFLGKVQLSGTTFVSFSDAIVFHYPLEKRGMFSRVKGELGLKVFITDDPSIKATNSIPVIGPESQSHEVPVEAPSSKTARKKHTFHSIPKERNQQAIPASPVNETVKYAADSMKIDPQTNKTVRTQSSTSIQPVEYALKETSPCLGGAVVVGGRVIRTDKPASTTYDLVEQMLYLFVRVVKARDLPSMDITGSLDPYVEVKVGNYNGKTKHFEKKQNPEWNQVFAFSKERMQASIIEVVVKDKDMVKDDLVGILRFDLHDVPMCVPPDSPVAPEWYNLQDKKGDKAKGELMLAIWIGTQADEAFADAWHSDTASVDAAALVHIKSKVYHAPRLWYVRVNIVEAHDVVIADKTRFPCLYVKAQIGNQSLRTKAVQSRTFRPFWNEDLLFVAAEPFEDHLILSLEDHVAENKDEVLGRVTIQLSSIDKRVDDRIVHGYWHNLEKPDAVDTDQSKKDKFSTRIHLRLCLDGGYHVLDESTQYSSDLRPTAKQLWKPAIGLLELGILGASCLHPMKTREEKGTSDAYCVAKYGHKWVRTRTIVNSLCPKYNEQYRWEVHDPATVLTIGVFDNGQLDKKDPKENKDNKDAKIGKVRIRLSTLETGRVYAHSYPLLVLEPSGIKKMGELHLAIRFSTTSVMNLMCIYSRPLLPKMHYVRPLKIVQLDMLRHQAVQIVATRLGRAEPPLRKEVVEYISDFDSHLWSIRRSKANFFRLISVFSGLFRVGKWFGDICAWKNSIISVLAHILFLILACFPELIISTIFIYMFFIGIWNYRYRPRYPPHMNTKFSHADGALPDELDEEFDTFPSSRSPEIIKDRYDRLRFIAGRIQTMAGDIATQCERIPALLSWRDPRATTIFVIFCFISALVFYVTPFQVIAAVIGFYKMRHPRFRHKMPSAPINFFRRLPAEIDSML